MRINIKNAVHPIAWDVRKWAESIAKYPDDDLCGLCGIASAELWRRLNREGIPAMICVHTGYSGSHVFLEVDGHIVDVTATQFGQLRNSKVVVLNEGEAKAYDFYEVGEVFSSDVELKKWQKKSDWPEWQIAHT